MHNLILLISVASTTIPVKCFGQSDASAIAFVSGGTASYTYEWNPTAQTTQTATNLPVGIYTVTVTDHHLCTAIAVDTIKGPTKLGITLIPDSVLCYNGTTGGILSIDTGGTGAPNYTYHWNNGQIGQNLISVPAGVYTLTLTDINGCTAVASAQVLQPQQLKSFIATGTDTVLLCGGPGTNIGSISLNIVGGTFPWSYHWSNGDTTRDIMSLGGGVYTLTITDAKGCTNIRTFVIKQPSPLQIHIDSLNALCKDSCDGQITSAITGGTPSLGNYTYQWNNGQTTANIIGLCRGIYNLIVTDSNGCQVSRSTSIGIKTYLQASFTASPTSGYVPLNVSFAYNGTDSVRIYIIGHLEMELFHKTVLTLHMFIIVMSLIHLRYV